ncbi:MAG: hypothetical protein ACO3GX_06360 [Gemmataceae bacterium]
MADQPTGEWKYKVIGTSPVTSRKDMLILQRSLNEAGKAGWELVGFIPNPNSDAPCFYVLKKSKDSPLASLP